MKTDEVRWGILGPGGIAKAFAVGVKQAPAGTIVALGSRDIERARAFAGEMGLPDAACHGSYEALLADADVDAIYIATPHPMHAHWVIRAAEAGKHVLVEKPAGMNHAEGMAAIQACREAGVFFMEAFKDRCHPQTDRLVQLLREGVIGEVRMVQVAFGFDSGDAFDPNGRAFNPALGGGAILDVGCYPVQYARKIAGVVENQPFADPVVVKAVGTLGETGVDEWASATLKFASGMIAEVSTAIRASLDNRAVIVGSHGRIVVPDPWISGRTNIAPGRIEVTRDGKTETIGIPTEFSVFGYEALAAAQAIADGNPQADAMPWDDTLGSLVVLDRWRREIGLTYPADTPAGFPAPLCGRPIAHRDGHPMRYGRIAGLDKDISKFVMGCDNQETFPHSAVMFDDWWERGGNAFDTAHLYNGGKQERLLGAWLKSRGVRDDAVIISKGAHTPNNFPQYVAQEFHQSLERLGCDHADIYMLHRDNLDVPVGEFVDVLDELAGQGLLRVFGGSNWSLERIAQANAYARANGKRLMSASSNNFSLARMVHPVWDGCVSASDPPSIAFLEQHNLANFAWSSQARGYFTSPDAQGMKTPWEHDGAFDSEDNRERRRRAFELADDKGCTGINIAAAYVLEQNFPSFALFGPRKLWETATSLPALDIELTAQEQAYLDLRTKTLTP